MFIPGFYTDILLDSGKCMQTFKKSLQGLISNNLVSAMPADEVI